MDTEVRFLITTAVAIGFLHTLLGPDHYIPFVAMARSNNWSKKKTLGITTLCGLGHIASSVVIGALGLFFGSVLMRIEAFESLRGDVAAWLLISFGLAYLTWGIIQAIRDIPHTHMHSHADGTLHSHLHKHDLQHRHVHDCVVAEESKETCSLTPWILFLIFAFGPCEVLIPLLMYPAANADLTAVFLVVAAFSLATVGTMVAAVMLIVFGLDFVRFPDMHRFSHAIAGFALLACGTLMKFGL